MIQNFNDLLHAVNQANNRSQLETAYDVANTFLSTWLDAQAINSVDFHAKTAQLDDAYHNQLTEFQKSPISVFLGQVAEKACSEVKS